MSNDTPDIDTDAATDAEDLLYRLKRDADAWPDGRTLKPAGPLFELMRQEKRAEAADWNHYLAALYLQRPRDTSPAAVDTDALADEIVARLETGGGDGDVDAEAVGDALARSLDYDALANRVAAELEGRMGR
jgi:hypothetical protein